MRPYKSYSGDPYWTTARFDSKAADGTPVRKGERIFYYPRTKCVLVGMAADQAYASFQSAAADEAFESGQY